MLDLKKKQYYTKKSTLMREKKNLQRLRYQYKNEKFYVTLDGANSTRVGNLPKQEDQTRKDRVKKFFSITRLATKAANKPNKTNKVVAIKLCAVFFAISLKVLLANLHPTDAPRISKQ